MTKEERDQLKLVINKGKHSSLQFKNAYILLSVDKGEHGEKITNAQIAQVLQVNTRQVSNHRIESINNEAGKVTFNYKDYRSIGTGNADGDKQKQMTLTKFIIQLPVN